MEEGVTALDTNLSTSLVSFPSLLVVSLGGLLHNRLLERLEGHMEDTHCPESATKTQATRRISMLGHRLCCRMRPLADVISPWFVLSLILPLGWSVLHMVSCTQALLLFLSLFHKGSHHSLFSLLSCLKALRGRTSCTWSRSPGISVRPQGWDHYSPADSWPCPPTNPCCHISLD